MATRTKHWYWLVKRFKFGTGKAKLILAEAATIERIKRAQQLYGCGRIRKVR